jgi:hypothetical protein
MDTARLLLEKKGGNKYVIMSIDHYFKWNEAKVVPSHGVKTTANDALPSPLLNPLEGPTM